MYLYSSSFTRTLHTHTHTHTHIVPPSAPHLFSPLTDSEGRWRMYPPRHAVSSSPDLPYHLRPFSRLAVTFSSVTLPTWLPGTDITIQKWATTLPSLQQTQDEIRILTAYIHYSTVSLLCLSRIPKGEDGGGVEVARKTRALHYLLYLKDREIHCHLLTCGNTAERCIYVLPEMLATKC